MEEPDLVSSGEDETFGGNEETSSEETILPSPADLGVDLTVNQ